MERPERLLVRAPRGRALRFHARFARCGGVAVAPAGAVSGVEYASTPIRGALFNSIGGY